MSILLRKSHTLFLTCHLFFRGGPPTKLLAIQHAIELVMVLPGKVAKETRVQFANVLRRYMAGDESLVDEVRANAQSTSPVAQLARQSLPPQQEETVEDRKRRREIEDVDLQCKRMSVATSFISSMSLLNPTWADDARLRVQTQDLLKNIALRPPGSQFLLEENGSSKPSTASLTISDVAADMGLRLKLGKLSQAGVSVAAAYRRRYGRDPPRRQQFVDGAERWVKAYTEADRDLISEALSML